MWKLIAKKEIVQGDMIALVHKNKVVLEGKYYPFLSNGCEAVLCLDDSVKEIPDTYLRAEFSNEDGSEGKVYLSVDGEYLGDPDYEFYKWESIPVKFDLNAFRGN